ncbi:hypothetical protein D3C80_1807110 [compost metagenome]
MEFRRILTAADAATANAANAANADAIDATSSTQRQSYDNNGHRSPNTNSYV